MPLTQKTPPPQAPSSAKDCCWSRQSSGNAYFDFSFIGCWGGNGTASNERALPLTLAPGGSRVLHSLAQPRSGRETSSSRARVPFVSCDRRLVTVSGRTWDKHTGRKATPPLKMATPVASERTTISSCHHRHRNSHHRRRHQAKV